MFKDTLRDLRISKSVSQRALAEYIGVSQQLIAKYESGASTPSPYALSKIANLFGVSTDFLVGIDSVPQSKKGVKIPVLGYVRAGIPIEALENTIDYEEISQEMARQGDFFALKIVGDSMEPRILEGDVIIVRKQSDVDSGDVAVILVNGDAATVKRVYKSTAGIQLVASNEKAYSPHFYSNEEIETLPVQIIGKMVELRGKF